MTGPRYTGGTVLYQGARGPGKSTAADNYAYVEISDEQLAEMKAKADARAKRQKEVEEEFGPGARVVTPYRPNRHQRRLQERARKKAAKRSK